MRRRDVGEEGEEGRGRRVESGGGKEKRRRETERRIEKSQERPEATVASSCVRDKAGRV